MTTHPTTSLRLAALVALIPAASTLHAQALLFDFGTSPATGQVTVNATAAPSLGGPAGLTGNITYNTVSGTDNNNTSLTFPGTYQYSNGTTATGLSLSFMSGSTASPNQFNTLSAVTPFTRNGFSAARSGIGVFATPSSPNNTALFRDIAASANGDSTTDTLALSISGLAAGQYTVYVIINNTYNTANGDVTRTVRVGTGASGLTSLGSVGTANTLNFNYTNIVADTATWSAAENKYWTSISATVDATNNTLYIASHRFNDQQGGVFNAIQIVPVPEPSAFAALAGLGALGFAASRRRRRA
jgi:hypothetical protein